MDQNQIDFAGLPTTLAVIGVVALIVIALKAVNRLFPEIAERFKAMTPWMGWVVKDDTVAVPPFLTRALHPLDR